MNRVASYGDSSLDDPKAWLEILGSNFSPSPVGLPVLREREREREKERERERKSKENAWWS